VKTVEYQSRPGGPKLSQKLCSRYSCPDPFPGLDRAPVKRCGMLCQYHSKIELNSEVFVNDAGETFIRFDDPRHPGERIAIRTSLFSSIDNARIPVKYCSDPNDTDRAKEIFIMMERRSARSRSSVKRICCNSSCQTIVILEGLYCRPCAEAARDVVYNPSDRLTTFTDIGPDGIEEIVTFEWVGLRRLPYYAYVQIGTPEERGEEIVAKMTQVREQIHDYSRSARHRAIANASAAKASAARNTMNFDAIGQDFTAREALFFVGPRRMGESIDFSEFQGKAGMFIFHLSLRRIEDFDTRISDNQIMLSPSSTLSEESRNALQHKGHSSNYNYASGNPATLGSFLAGHWPQQVRSVMQRDGSIEADLFVFFPVDRDYHSFSQVRINGGHVPIRLANMVRSAIKVTSSMIIRCKFHRGNINLQDPKTEFTVLYADGNMNKRLDLPLDHESFVTTDQGIFTRGYYEKMAKEGKVDYIDLLPDADVSQSYEVDDVAESTSVVPKCLMTQRANVLSSMAQHRSSDDALISTLQETICDIEDTPSSRAMDLLFGHSSLFCSTVAHLAFHESPGVREQANHLLEATVTRAYINSSHRDGSLVRRIVEAKLADILSAKRKAKFAKEYAKNKEELVQLQNDIKIRRQKLELSLSSRKATEALSLSSSKHCTSTVTPSPPPPKRQKISALECMFKFQSSKGDHSFMAKLSSTDTSSIPDSLRRVISKAVFDCRSRSRKKLVSTAPVDKFTRVISSNRSEVFQAKLYSNKYDESDCKLFIAKYNHLEEIPFWKVTEKVWVYAVPPFALSQLDITDSKRMHITIVKQS